MYVYQATLQPSAPKALSPKIVQEALGKLECTKKWSGGVPDTHAPSLQMTMEVARVEDRAKLRLDSNVCRLCHGKN